MDKNKKLKIALPILFIVMAFVWGPIFFGSSSDRKADNNIGHVSSAPQKDTESLDLTALSNSTSQKKARTTYVEWGQNPFMLKRAPKAINIEGILWDKNNPKAIINGNIVGIGDVIESKTIMEIKPDSVIIKGDEGEIELTY